jgi:hypothetical protein
MLVQLDTFRAVTKFTFFFPAFMPDSRGNKLEKFAVRPVRDSDHSRLYLCGPDEVAEQAKRMLEPTASRLIKMTPEQQREWSHRLHVDGPVPDDVRETLALLEEILTLTKRTYVDAAFALDFYKDPESDPDPQKWKDTSAGSMVHMAKYYGYAEALDALASVLAKVINGHALLRTADLVVSVPGHDTTRVSFGEQVAEAVAKKTGKPLVGATAAHERRPAAKEREKVEGGIDLEDEFTLPDDVDGRVVIVIDDVYRSGQTMEAAAKAAKKAGADRVYGLVGARTMRSR